MAMVHRLARSILAGAILALALAAPAFAADDVKVVASGLDNPRGLNFGPGGDLYVAEAGKGGTVKCVPGGEGGGQVCFGSSGAVTRVGPDGTDQKRITTGLPSQASPEGTEAIGPATGQATRGFPSTRPTNHPTVRPPTLKLLGWSVGCRDASAWRLSCSR